jgi:ubiquinone/menaquinone biosynthesis methyltransferase
VYDQLNDVLSLGLHRAWKRATVKWSEAKKGDTVLDVCCGSGDIAQRLSDRVGDEGTVFGLDFAENQLRRAAEKMEEKTPTTSNETNTAKITWVQGDALELPFEDDTFDAITMGYGLRNVRDIPKALSELKRVAKSGTKVAILDFNNSRDETTNQISGFILDNVVVPFAKMNDVEAEYKYLRPSIERFPTGPELVDLALAAGFEEATHYELQPGGLMGCLVCQV